MKKKLLLLCCLLCADMMVCPTLYSHSAIDELHEYLGDEEPVLDMDDNGISSNDEDLLALLDEPMEKPSLLWTWFCTVGSAVAVQCIHAQRYMGRLFERMACWFKRRRASF